MGEVTTLQKNIIIFVDIYTCLRLVRIQSAKIFPIKIIILNKNREELINQFNHSNRKDLL